MTWVGPTNCLTSPYTFFFRRFHIPPKEKKTDADKEEGQLVVTVFCVSPTRYHFSHKWWPLECTKRLHNLLMLVTGIHIPLPVEWKVDGIVAQYYSLCPRCDAMEIFLVRGLRVGKNVVGTWLEIFM